MIVHCEGCESGFHVDEHLIKPTGSKLRCSKCRHVFTAYPPAPADEAEEPLILSDALPAAEAAPGPAEMSDIDFKLDEVFGEAAGEVPELLDVEDLLAGEPPPKEAFKASQTGAEFDLDLTPAAADDMGDTLPDLDELEIDLSMLEGTAETAAAAPGKRRFASRIRAGPRPRISGARRSRNRRRCRADALCPRRQEKRRFRPAARRTLWRTTWNFDLEMADAKTTTLPKDTGVKRQILGHRRDRHLGPRGHARRSGAGAGGDRPRGRGCGRPRSGSGPKPGTESRRAGRSPAIDRRT